MTIFLFTSLAFIPYITAYMVLILLAYMSGTRPTYSDGEKVSLFTLLLVGIAIYLFVIVSIAFGAIILTGISVLIQG